MSVKYDLKKSKDAIGVLYPRIVDKDDREIDGFHRVDADEDWPTRQLDHIDTDVKYWTARITANTHRRGVSKKERKESVIELAKALLAEGYEPSLVNPICVLTTFSPQYIGNLLEDNPEFLKHPGAGGPKGVKPGLTSEQTPKRKTKHDTSDKEKLDNLYKKVQKSAFNGQKPTSQSSIEKAEKLGLDVTHYTEQLENIRQVLNDSVGRQYADVKDDLNDAYKRSTGMKKVLTAQISAEETRITKLKESLRNEVAEEVTQEVVEMTENERLEKLLEEIPDEFSVLRDWVREGFWSIDQIKSLLNNPAKKKQLINILEKAPKKLLEGVKTRKTSLVYANTVVNRLEKHDSPPPLPDGVFDVIYADPPWKYDLPLRGSPNSHYDIMSNEDIYNLNVEGVSIQDKITEDSILFLWATNPKLTEALSVVKKWGFDYKTNLVWVKDKIGTGYYVRGQHELLLISTKGKIPPPIEKNRFSSVLTAPRKKHSAKPEEVYEIIEVMYPNRRYLELFARNQRENWTSWGLEA